MLPVRDVNKSYTTPHVNRILLIINILVFVVTFISEVSTNSSLAGFFEREFIMVPDEIIHGQRIYTILTSMFMHYDLLHIFGNMLFLYIFGDNVEDAFGHISYLILYLLCGFTAAFGHAFATLLTNPSDLVTGVLGASGAISGVLGAYVVLYPRARILTIIGFAILPLPAILFLGIWFLLQWFYGFFDISGGVAYWAHVTGFLTGMVAAFVYGRQRKNQRETKRRF